MPRENAEAKGRRYLTEGRLLVVEVTDQRIRAFCRGDGALHRCGMDGGGRWWCMCPARGDRCAHLTALRLVCVANQAQERRPRPPTRGPTGREG